VQLIPEKGVRIVKADRNTGNATRVTWGALLVALFLLPATAQSGVKVAESEGFTLELGMRLQPRLEYENLGGDWRRDFLLRRTRLKANGKMLSATYGFEWKIDSNDLNAAITQGEAENAWIQFPLGKGVELKAGLYDQPFSRDRLVSDSRQLAVDRGLASNVPNGLGLADNATGFEFLGKAAQGKVSYWAGLFDNRLIPTRFQDTPMVVGRVDLNLGSTSDIYQDAHFGTAEWYSIGINGSYQPINTAAGGDSVINAAAGIDGMIDVPTRAGRVFLRAEASDIQLNPAAPGATRESRQYLAEAGVLILHERLQPFVRFDEVRAAQKTDVTYLGMNLYKKGHSLKIQGDVRMQANTNQSVDGARVQAQLDF
jgi:hypothetical protein